jgi:ComF family protein
MNLINRLINIIYPPRCPVCNEFLNNDPQKNRDKALSFCTTCLADFRKISSPLCPICGRPFVEGTDEDHLCEDCLRKRPLYEAIGAPYVYDGPLMTAIHRFKYGGKSYLADSLGPLLSEFAKSWIQKPDGFLTVPVPLHKKRLRERGFNQSLLLAKHVACELHTALDFLSLRRVRYTLPQTGLGKEERRKNVRGAFMLENPEVFKDKPILLVDDVATTGNTLNECSRVLRKAGCKDIFCLVLARTANF